MARWMLTLVGCWGCLLWMIGGGATRGNAANNVFCDELPVDRYDCMLTLRAANTPANSTVDLTLEDNARGNHLRLLIAAQAITLDHFANKKVRRIARVNNAVSPGATLRLFVLRRDKQLWLLRDDAVLFHGEVPRSLGAAAVVAGAGWRVLDARIQPLEPVVFADNFMRTADESGGWALTRGTWRLQSAWDNDPKGAGERFRNVTYAQNPFAWVGRAGAKAAWCTVGKSFWEDYTASASVQPGDGAVGLAVNVSGTGTGVLARWTAAGDGGEGELCLCRVNDGVETVLARAAGGYLPGQWYRLAITTTLNDVSVSIDGRERLSIRDVTPRRGCVGLYTAGSATFDDITVYGREVKTDLLTEHRQARFNQRFQQDDAAMADWASARRDWVEYPGMPGMWLHRWDFYGDAWLSLTLHARPAGAGQLCFALGNDGQSPTAGNRAVVQYTGNTLTCKLYRDATVLASGTASALKPNEDYTLRFRRTGNRLLLERDGETLAEVIDPTPSRGVRVAYRADGCFAAVDTVTALSRNLLDYSFDDAPVDWLAEGAWMPTTRWACTPHWSFLGGWSRGDAVLWHKQRFNGDQSFQAFVALKMEYPRERQIYEQRSRDFNLTICGDGHDPRSGYAALFGASNAQGFSTWRTVLLRNGVEVASTYGGPTGIQNGGHTAWTNLVLRKHGAVIEFWAQGRQLLTYTDPNPLAGGVPAIWTTDNGLALARARLSFAEPPQPQISPLVALAEPWSPEWTNVGQPLPVEFSTPRATTGDTPFLRVTPRRTPPGNENSAVVAADRVTITPKTPGDYWYQVNAVDDTTVSPAVHLAFHAFDAGLRRDDSHALVLYNFTDGPGGRVRDQSGTTPPADLVVPANAPAQWLPGQGLMLKGPCALTTEGGVPKLDAIRTKKAATFEFWISADTIFPPLDWTGCLLAWQKSNTTRNIAITQMRDYLLVAPCSTSFSPRSQPVILARGVRTGLQHLVVTWDGVTTLCYRNGILIGRGQLPWQTERWTADVPLILGDVPAKPRLAADEVSSFLHIASYILTDQRSEHYSFMGTYYQVAIHDRCFSRADVLRHFNAGPGAR